MIFFDHFKVPTIKFGKCFAELMIPIALLKKFNNLLRLLKSVTCEDATLEECSCCLDIGLCHVHAFPHRGVLGRLCFAVL